MVETLIKTYNKKIKKYHNSGDKEWEWVRARAIITDAILQLIQDTVNDETDEKDNRNTSNHSASDSNSNSRWCHRYNNGGVDKLSTGTNRADADINKRTNPSIQ